MTSSEVSILASFFSFAHSLSCFLSVCLSTFLSTFFFSDLAAFSDRLPSYDHTPLGFLHITLVAQADEVNLFLSVPVLALMLIGPV